MSLSSRMTTNSILASGKSAASSKIFITPSNGTDKMAPDIPVQAIAETRSGEAPQR